MGGGVPYPGTGLEIGAVAAYAAQFQRQVIHWLAPGLGPRRPADAAKAPLPVPLILTHGAGRLPPSGSTAGCARHAAFTPLRLDCGLRPLADSPSRGSRRSRAARRRLMRWGVDAGAARLRWAPTAICGRRIRGFLEPSGWRPGIIFCLPIPTRPRRRRIASSGVFPAPFPVR